MPTRKERQRGLVQFSVISLLVVALSQIGSLLVIRHLAVGETYIVNGFLHLTHVRNMGGVFGLFQGHGWVFGLTSLALIAGLIIYLWKSRDIRPGEFLCFGFIAGGGTSNILDRLIHGSVVDFINLQGIPYWHYVFNTADVMVHVGLWPLLFMTLWPQSSTITE